MTNLLKSRLKQLTFLSLLAGLILIPEASSVAVLYSIGVVLSLVVVSQIVRIVIFRYIDLEQYANKALEGDVASSVVFASVVLYTLGIIFAGVMMLS